MTEMVQANARVPEAARPVLLGVAARLRDNPGFLDRLQAFLADEAGGSPWADRIEAIEARLAALEAGATASKKHENDPEANRQNRQNPGAVENFVSACTPAALAAVRGAEDGTTEDWPVRAAAITISTGEGRERRLTAEGAVLFGEMVKAGVRNPEIARVLGMARQSVDARAKKIGSGH